MPALHKNRVKMTVTSAPGTSSPVTLVAASTGHQSFATAYGANATVDALISNGTDWEVQRGVTYTHSGTTVSRGTPEASSNGGALVNFSSATNLTVEEILTAGKGNLIESALLEHVAASPTTAGVTGVVGTLHLLDISGLTASRNFTLPAVAAVGDRVGVYLTTGDDTYALILIGDTGDTINGGSAATEWSRLLIANECVIFRCITANSAWVVEYDGRIQSMASMTDAASTTTLTASTFVKIGIDTADVNIGGIANTGSSRVDIRRSGKYSVSGFVHNYPNADQTALVVLVYKNGSAVKRLASATMSGSGGTATSGASVLSLVAGDYLELWAWCNDTTPSATVNSSADLYSSLNVVELV